MQTSATIPWQLRGLRSGFRLLDTVAPRVAGSAALELFLRPQRRRRTTAGLEQAQRVELPFPDGPLQGYLWGSGPLVLLMHGWESDAGAMVGFVEPLLRGGFRVAAIDGPAHGRSPGKHADLLRFSEAVHTAIRAWGPASGVIAHSFGAAATLWLLRQHDAPRIPAVALISGPADVGSQLHAFASVVGLPEQSVAALFAAFRRRFGLAAEEVSLTEGGLQPSGAALVVHDREDQRIPFEHGQRIAAAWPGAELMVTTGLGHNRIVREPEVCAAVAQFIQAHQPSPDVR